MSTETIKSSGDDWVRKVQQWLNDTFPEYFKYDETGEESGSFPVKVDGLAGNTTVKALIRAIQICGDLLPPDGVWGNNTAKVYKNVYAGSGEKDVRLNYILQGAFYCKGYDPKGFDGIYGSGVTSAIRDFQTDLGITVTGIMTPEIFKSLLSTDPTIYNPFKNGKIRSFQQFLNKHYFNLFGKKLGYIPTDGVYERKTNKALIYAVQSAMGTTPDGSIGTNTYKALTELHKGSSEGRKVYLLKGALNCNGYDVELSETYDDALVDAVTGFQQFMCLNIDPTVELGSVNRRTWAALLHSKGDPERTANACDCATILDKTKALALKEKGYECVGRYLTGTVKVNGERVSKALSRSEIQTIWDAGLKFFLIYQDGGASSDYFKMSQGYQDAKKAIAAADNLKLPAGEIIYFAVDYDFTSEECRNYIIPHFIGISDYVRESGNKYRIGVYGSRNICKMICNSTDAMSSFVADMSTGYSGNLGYTIPNNWAFEQFHEYTLLGSGFSFAVDKNMSSGRYPGISADSKCGQENFFDCTIHDMKLDKNGYYKCSCCNYSVPSPFLQDKDILTPDDYLVVTGLTYAYSILLADIDTYGIYFHDLWDKIYRIRSNEMYNGKYSYCDANKNCLFVPPEVDPTGVEIGTSALQGPILIDNNNFDKWNGTFDPLFEAAADFIMGMALPQNLYTQIALAIQNYIHEGNVLSSLNSVLQAIVGETDASAFGYILQLLELGIDITEKEEHPKIAVGDTLVYVSYMIGADGRALYIIFDSDLKFKTCYFES